MIGTEDATHTEKVRATFDELDLKRTRGFGLEEWMTILQRLNIGFNVGTMRDLFDKADSNHDGVVSYNEFQRFAEIYPTLLDSLYFRSKDYWTDIHQRESIEAAREQEKILIGQEEQTKLQHIDSQRLTDEQNRRFQLQNERVLKEQQNEEALRRIVETAHADTEACRLNVRDCAAAHADSRGNERVLQNALNESRQATEGVAATLKEAEQQVGNMGNEIMDLERQLAEKKMALDRLLQNAERIRMEMNQLSSNEQLACSAVLEAQHAVKLSGDRLSGAEADLEGAITRERDANEHVSLASAELTRCITQRDVEERELLTAKERENLSKTAEEETTLMLQDHLRVISAMDAQNIDFNNQRREVETDEAPLLEQEIQLREQRSSLENREAQLRNHATTFTTTRRSPSPTLNRRAIFPTSGTLAMAGSVSATPRFPATAPVHTSPVRRIPREDTYLSKAISNTSPYHAAFSASKYSSPLRMRQ
eukprot:TRINITY_DN6623_c1_g2_i1.p1 TRINITY_DN6623_c1_g2~~TRINITY_DN6623_c1_g2_i1.p1  ORF type:complete len:481 (+),score=92.69 TRINITY_DN6623_c1_g2_i1:54-1496(+)